MQLLSQVSSQLQVVMVTTSPATTGDQRAKAVVCHFRLGWLTADGFCSVAVSWVDGADYF